MHWGDGNGKGFPYDAGHMNVCKHLNINGYQHPSIGYDGTERNTQVYAGGEEQTIMTRWNFGCVLFENILDRIKDAK